MPPFPLGTSLAYSTSCTSPVHRGDADGENGEFSPGFVTHAARDAHHHALAQFDFFMVQGHRSLPADDVVNLIGTLVGSLACAERSPVDRRPCCYLSLEVSV